MGSRSRAEALRKTVDDLAEFVREKKVPSALTFAPPDDILKAIRLCLSHPREMETLAAYVRRYKVAAERITATDVAEARDLSVVRSVLES